MMYGIDVSKWQRSIDWKAVKQSGVDFAIIKAGGSDRGLYTDPYFEYNYNAAKAAGIPIGAYYFVGPKFWTAADGKADAKRFLARLAGKSFELPVYLDIENQNRAKKRGITDAAIAFCEYMEEHGAFIGIYGSEISTFDEMVYSSELTAYSWWIANYSRKPKKQHLIWQYTSEGRVGGIRGNVDINEANMAMLKDVMEAIKREGLNRWT